MGTGCSQHEASQSQQKSQEEQGFCFFWKDFEPSYTEVEENIYIKATPKNSRLKEVQGTEKTTIAQVKQKQQLPHNYEAIVKDADSPINKSAEHLFGHLYAGILLNQKRKKYWIDKNSNNCFMVYPRDLTITWAEDNRYWNWPSLVEETSNVSIDVAELLDVCWLDVNGQFDAAKLSPGTLYEVVFVVMLKAEGGGWEVPVNASLSLPDGNKQERKVNLMEKARGQWIEIPVGEFRASPGKLGDIKFSMYEHGGHWKNGLVIKGVAIRPKN